MIDFLARLPWDDGLYILGMALAWTVLISLPLGVAVGRVLKHRDEEEAGR